MSNNPGLDVSLSVLVMKGAEAVRAWRDANVMSDRIFNWLSDNPVPNEGPDPLMQDPYNLSVDGAYLYRFVFGGLHDLNVEDLLSAGRKLTGLE